MAEFIFSQRYDETLSRIPDVPQHLYKYRSLRGASGSFSKAILANAEVYFARPLELNDPFDCKPHNTMESTAAERKAFLAWVTKGREPELSRAARRQKVSIMSAGMRSQIAQRGFESVAQDAYENNLRDTGVLSLSADPSSNLMWSHYGDAHHGICIQFNFSALLPLCPMPVTYSDARPSYNVIRNVADLEELAFLRKSAEWSYEQEWRAIGLWWSGSYRLPGNAVTGVILGAAISTESREEVLDWVRESGRDIEIKQARFQSSTYQLTFDPVEI